MISTNLSEPAPQWARTLPNLSHTSHREPDDPKSNNKFHGIFHIVLSFPHAQGAIAPTITALGSEGQEHTLAKRARMVRQSVAAT